MKHFDLSNYGWGLPLKASSYAYKVDGALSILHWAMFIIFFFWAVYMAYCLINYRQSKSPKAEYTGHGTWKTYITDVLIFVFEVWLLAAVGIPIWAHIREDLPKSGEAVEVHVVAQQFNWLFQYPGPDGQFGNRSAQFVHLRNPLGIDPGDVRGNDDIISINKLYLPMGKKALLKLTSMDVIHSFFIPEFRLKQDNVPGMVFPVWVEPILTGTFEIGCAQLCGSGHYRMRGDAYVLSPEDFDQWTQTASAEMQQHLTER